MTSKKDKRTFVRNFMRSVAEHILSQVDRMPDDWDGIELRQHIVDEVQREAIMTNPYTKREYASRYRQYKKARLTI